MEQILNACAIIFLGGKYMTQVFFVNYLNKVKIKVSSTKEVRELYDNYLPGLVNNEVCNYDYELILNNQLKNIAVPKNAKYGQAFAASCFYRWQDGLKTYAFTEGNALAVPHYLERNGKTINLYCDENNIVDVSIKVLREIILREMFKDGYVPIHSASFEKDGKANVLFGARNAGKSTSLLLFCKGLGYNPMSNDLTLIKYNNDKDVDVCGWFYKVSYQSRAESLLKMHAIEESESKKLKFFPRQFAEDNGLNWTWQAKLDSIINVQCDYFKDDYVISNVNKESSKSLLPYVYDEWGFFDYLDIYDCTPNIEAVFNKLSIKQITGNLAKLRTDILMERILKNNYFKDNFTFKKSKLGTGNNYKVVHNDKKYFAKLIFPINENIDYDHVPEIECYKKLKDTDVPVKHYLTTFNNDLYVAGKDYYVNIQEWSDGETFGNFSGDEDYLIQCAECLAKINVNLEGLNLHQILPNVFEGFDKSIDQTTKLLQRLESKQPNKHNDKIKDCLTWKLNTLNYLKTLKWPNWYDFKFGNSHGDFSILQTIALNNKLYKVIDFENAGKCPLIWEIMRSFALSDKEKTTINKDRLEKYINAYTAINPIPEFDLQNKYKLYLAQLIQSNYGFYNYIDNNDDSNLDFAYWRIDYCKELLKEMENENRI